MRQPLLTVLRGYDGRALARALAVLFFLSAVVGQLPGVHQAATAGFAPVLCAAGSDAPDPAPSDDDSSPCCLAVCTGSHAPAVAPPDGALSGGREVQIAAAARPAGAIPLPKAGNRFQPRGPPLLA